MAKIKTQYNPEPDSAILPRYSQGAAWAKCLLKRKRPKKQEPGRKKRDDTCQLTPLLGKPRKYWMRARARKDKNYAKAMAFFDAVNRDGGAATKVIS